MKDRERGNKGTRERGSREPGSEDAAEKQRALPGGRARMARRPIVLVHSDVDDRGLRDLARACTGCTCHGHRVRPRRRAGVSAPTTAASATAAATAAATGQCAEGSHDDDEAEQRAPVTAPRRNPEEHKKCEGRAACGWPEQLRRAIQAGGCRCRGYRQRDLLRRRAADRD